MNDFLGVAASVSREVLKKILVRPNGENYRAALQAVVGISISPNLRR